MIWLIGNKGMLGSELEKQLNNSGIPVIGTDREVDITNLQSLKDFAKGKNISWIINCAAYTAVDKAEDEPELAKLLNETGPENIAQTAKTIGAKLIHISTDYVFDGKGTKPYPVNTERNPQSVYGKTKADGEKVIEDILPDSHYIIRTAWLYGYNGPNFIYTMIKLMNSKEIINVVNDQKGCPTNAHDLAGVIIELIKKETSCPSSVPSGIYHYGNEGQITWYEFAKAIQVSAMEKGLIKKGCIVNSCTSIEFNAKAIRPQYSVFDLSKIKSILGIEIPSWESSLENFLSHKELLRLS